MGVKMSETQENNTGIKHESKKKKLLLLSTKDVKTFYEWINKVNFCYKINQLKG